MIKLAKEIGIDGTLIEKLEALGYSGYDLNLLEASDDLTRLAICLNYAKAVTAETYRKLNIPREIFIDTLHDVAIWCENNCNRGLKNYCWILNHLKAELFKIGRLQYQLYKCDNDTLEYDYLPFDIGDNLIYVHIPQGEKLIYRDCLISLKSAKEFFERHFPEFEYEFFFTESWLMYRENQLFMIPDSNILQFQTLFDIVYSVPDDEQAIQRIFGKRRKHPIFYPAKTALQKQAKRFMLKGGMLGTGIGIISRNDL